jgi:hypothetical protein
MVLQITEKDMRIIGDHKQSKAKERKEISRLKEKLFKLVKKICREKYGGCIMAHHGFGECSRGLQASHIKSEGAWKNLRFDPSNIQPMCFKHHFYSWHKDITETSEWFKKNFRPIWDYLEREKKTQHIDFNNLLILQRLSMAAKEGYSEYCEEYIRVRDGA